jgi:CO/xanthine dehydrogenase FAD-binding subunit
VSRIDRAETIDEAVELLATSGARPIAGGVAILLRKQLGEPPAEHHVAIGSIGDLRAIQSDPASGELRVGAAVTLAELAASASARAVAPMLVAAAGAAASPGIRSVATLGGNLVDAPADSDLVAAAWALGALLEIRGPDGTRLAAPGTPLRRDELLVSARLPGAPRGGWGLRRLATQGRADRPALTVSVRLVAEDDVVTALHGAGVFLGNRPLDLGGLGAVVIGARPVDLAEVQLERRIADEALAAADAAVGAGLVLRDDLRASAGYRRLMVGVLATRAVRDAAAMIGADAVRR